MLTSWSLLSIGYSINAGNSRPNDKPSKPESSQADQGESGHNIYDESGHNERGVDVGDEVDNEGALLLA